MIKLPFLFLLLFTTIAASSQNVGVNTTNPKVSLDVQGGFATRAVTIAPAAGNAVNIPANASLVIISGGSATATINGLYPGAYTDGQRMIIYNTNAAGFDVLFFGASIPLNQAREFICRNPGGWSLLSGALSTEGWGLKGNAGTDTAVNFIGTKDEQPLRFKINNENAGQIDLNGGNTGLGYLSLSPKGFSNTAFGANSLSSNKSGYNTAIGRYAMPGDVNGVNNVAIGASSMLSSKNSKGAVAIGMQALYSDTAADAVVAIGRAALHSGTLLRDMVAIGDSAMYSYNDVSGILIKHNVAIGTKALYGSINSFQNTAVGSYALSKNNSQSDNTAIGAFSLYSNIGEQNTAVGTHSLLANKAGGYNTAVGYASLHDNDGGFFNTAIGYECLFSNRNGRGAVAIGNHALFYDTAANGIVAIGRAALYNNNGRAGNLAIGDSALFNNSIGLLTSDHQAINNIAIGQKSLLSNTSGSNNTALGFQALYKNSSSDGNTAVGSSSLESNDNGRYNTVIGYFAMYKNTSGDYNTALGMSALRNNSGNDNTALGYASGFQNLTGRGNVFIGNSAGYTELGSDKLYIENTIAGKDGALIYGDFAADSLLLNAKTVVKNNAIVKGYTKLGGYDADVPSIKMKKIMIPAGPAVNAFVSYPLGSGITDAKVVGIQVLLNYAGTWKMPPGYIDTPGYEYNVQVQNNNIVVVLKNGNSANIGSKPIAVIITYEE